MAPRRLARPQAQAQEVTYDVRRVGAEWCAFHPETGREIARSASRPLLEAYLRDSA